MSFDRLNQLDKLQHLTGDSPQDLDAQLKQIKMPVHIVNIYGVGTKHYCWFYTDSKIKKIKGMKNATSKKL